MLPARGAGRGWSRLGGASQLDEVFPEYEATAPPPLSLVADGSTPAREHSVDEAPPVGARDR
ncbi:hypothetical protein [Nocardiopsis sp. B62]|uniref:hypothetical protein n=1 Tax=Nocardiopsis sp. B62 TaxID=2824874 RepID=UPI001B37C81A|nr:hypothetical protein [Nocardiopsis sp. B62]MBQ1082708.1 hypothetical protein [Nocardiopsis sp. B62]